MGFISLFQAKKRYMSSIPTTKLDYENCVGILIAVVSITMIQPVGFSTFLT